MILSELNTEMIRRLVSLLVRTVTPYKSLSFYEQYFTTFERLHLHRDRESIGNILTIQFILLYFGCCHFLFFLLQPSSVRLLRILLVDFVWSLHLPVSFNLMTVFQAGMTMYFYYVVYLDGIPQSINNHMKNILFRSSDSSFELSFKLHCKVVDNEIQRIAWKAVNANQLFIFLIDLLSLFALIGIINLFVEEVTNWNYGPWGLFLILASFIIYLSHALLLAVNVLFFAHILILLASYSVSILAYLYLRVQVTLGSLRFLLNRHFTWTKMHSVEVDLGATLQIVFAADALFGKLVLVFLLVNIPCSALLLMILLTHFGHIQRIVLVGMLVLISEEYLATFVYHLAGARFSTAFHRCGPLLLRLSAHQHFKVGNFRARLRQSLLISRLHTQRQYGFTYAQLALITMVTFTKCVLLYGEVLMYAYTLLHN